MKILLLPGDGIGNEIAAEASKVLKCFPNVNLDYALIGGDAIDKTGNPFPAETEMKAKNSDAVLLGAVGGEKWSGLPLDKRPEKGLLAIRKTLGVYANIRPLKMFNPLIPMSPLKPEYLENLDFIIVRELTGDLYFGNPRGITGEAPNRNAINTMVYSEAEINRIAHVGFKMAAKRKKKLCSIDKANVLETMVLWRDVVSAVAKEYPSVELSHMYVDNAAMQLIKRPNDFDIILTPNMFGDILSDEAAVLSASLGLLPSASIGDKYALYEPIHGSAPDIAGQGIANPIGMILSVAMMMRHSFNNEIYATVIENAVAKTLADGFRTKDIANKSSTIVSTSQIGDSIVENIKNLLATS